MRRKIAMIAVLGGLAAGFGCNHIGGKTDCGYNPSDYPIPQPSPPYASYPVVPDGTPIPKVKDGGSDADVKKPLDKIKGGGFDY